MNVLLDSCIWGGALGPIAEAGHDATWVGQWGIDPRDAEILQRANEQRRVLVTLDKDFGELAIVRGVPHAGIVRIVSIPARQQGPAIVDVLRELEADLLAGAILTVYRDRVRVRLGGS